MAQSLLFIPDISGFTKFVHSTGQQHSKHIISELLEGLIDSNILDMELVEIEGDALYYFKQDYIPSEKDLLKQAEKMYNWFHTYLQSYEQRRICPCGACETASNLELKFVAHAGELDFIQVKDIRKPYGQETIQVHRILKNSIPLNEYLLVSKDLWKTMDQKEKADASDWKEGSDQLDFGDFKYKFIGLENWRSKIKTIEPIVYHQSTKADAKITKEIRVDPKALFELVSNLEYRKKWTHGVKKLIYKKDSVNRAGTPHVCVLKAGSINIDTFIERRENSSLVLGEITNNPPLADKISTLYIVNKAKNKGSELTFEVRLEGKGILFKLLKPILVSKIQKSIQKNIESIADQASDLVKTFKIS